MMVLRILRVQVFSLVGWMLYMYISINAAHTTTWHTIELRTPMFSQQVDDDEFEDSVHVTVPSTNAGR